MTKRKSSKNELVFSLDGVGEEVIRREKSKARELRKSRWWQNKIASGLCHYCQHKFSPKDLTMDHIVPLGRGGTSIKSNLASACKSCNTKKKTFMPVEWEEYMANLDKQ